MNPLVVASRPGHPLTAAVADGVVEPRWSVEADQQLRALGGRVTLDLVPGLGHGIDARALRHVLDHLQQSGRS